MSKFFDFIRFRKIFSFGAVDIFFTVFSVFLAFFLRFEGNFPPEYWPKIWIYIAVIAILNFLFLWRKQLYAFTWTFIGLNDLIRLLKALTYASAAFAVLIFIDRETLNYFAGFPRSVVFINYFLNLLFIGGIRIAKRSWEEIFKTISQTGSNTLIVGAGSEAEQVIRGLLTSKNHDYRPIGFVDYNTNKINTIIHGIKILGCIDDIPHLSKQFAVENVIIALGANDAGWIKTAIKLVRDAGIKKIKIIPQFSEILDHKISFEALKDVTIEDLLGREPVKIDTEEIKKFISGKKILITGAAGSIGSEICRQIAHFNPKEIVALDFNESGIFDMTEEFKIKFPKQKFIPVVVSINNAKKIDSLFGSFKPGVVFHAAAYKHVPLMEDFPEEAVETNIFGTLNVAQSAIKHGVEKFVFISTDKAVKPVAVMGKTKRVGEIIIQSLNKKGATRFSAVRFGNVLASRGSVVPIFQEQIRKRAPITVTDPNMMRYFMTIPEAALLVTETGAVSHGGEIFILDMGKPIKIVDLANELIRLSGLEPDKDIPIVYTGIRPGEKIFEELLTEEEKRAGATKWQKIFISKISTDLSPKELSETLSSLERNLNNPEKLKSSLNKLAPSD